MASSTSRLSYADCYELFDKALASDKGIRFQVVDKGAANQFRVRLHTARGLNRDDNRITYEKDHPLYGRSEYDALSVQVRKMDGKWYIRLVKFAAQNIHVEELTGDEVYGTLEGTTSHNGEAEGESEAPTDAPSIEAEEPVVEYATQAGWRRF